MTLYEPHKRVSTALRAHDLTKMELQAMAAASYGHCISSSYSSLVFENPRLERPPSYASKENLTRN